MNDPLTDMSNLAGDLETDRLETMSNAACKWCEAQWPVCYDKKERRFHVAENIRCIEPCEAIKYRSEEQAYKHGGFARIAGQDVFIGTD